MTPKEKAKELVGKFNGLSADKNRRHSIFYEEAKQCALICVDEILKQFNVNWTWCGINLDDKKRWPKEYEYWQEVKQEIEKL